jgi:CheY-like chemotaxis protein
VTETSEARQALKTVRHVRPHVVITDIVLPGKDGYWLAAELDVAGLSAVPVIGLSAYRRVEYPHLRQDRFSCGSGSLPIRSHSLVPYALSWRVGVPAR